MMTDEFDDYADSATAPSRLVLSLIPSDAADLTRLPKAIYVGTGGDVALVAADAPADAPPLVFKNLPSGSLLPVRARRVAATGTSAADMLLLL